MADVSSVNVPEFGTYGFSDASAEQTANKVTSIDANSTNQQYPSAQAVYHFVQGVDKGITWIDYLASSATIESAYQTGQVVLLSYNGQIAPLVQRVSATEHIFGVMVGNIAYSYTCTNNVWANSSTTLENAANKVTSIDESSTDIQYPSAAAVYVYAPSRTEFDTKADKVNNATAGDLAGLDADGNLTDSGVDPTTLAPLDSPVFTGVPEVPTAGEGTNSQQAASTAFVQAAVGPVAEAADNAQNSADTAEEYALKAYVCPTASGAVANFDAGADDIPVKSLVVDIEPVQNLNGYDAPWPPGGGKNLFPNETLTFTASESKVFTIDIPAGSYVFSGVPSAAGGITIKWRYADETIGDNTVMFSEQPFELPMEFTQNVVRLTIYCNAAITLSQLQLELGSTATAYEPYSNICPISGWTGAKVTRAGKNLLEFMTIGEVFTQRGMTGTVTDSGIVINGTPITQYAILIYFEIRLPPGIYYINGGETANIYAQVSIKRADDSIVRYTNRSFEVLSDDKSMDITIQNGQSTNTLSNYLVAAQLELGSTATAYEPYQGDTYDISFPGEAGTVYGGTLDVTSGVLTVSKVQHIISANEVTEGWANANYSQIAYAQILKPADGTQLALGVSKAGYFLMAEYSLGTAPPFDSSDLIGKVVYNADGARYWFGFPYGTALADMRSALDGKFFLYELATPITYQLTPTEVTTLLGVNNIWAVPGDSTVQYRADPTLIYNKLVAAIISSGGNV